MPSKFAKGFGLRRKSNTTPFEDVPNDPVAEQSFKVFERPQAGKVKSFDSGLKMNKAVTTPVGRTRTLQLEEDNMFVNVGPNRGSGASNTNTASTTDNSSRLSAASTAPSSTDLPHRDSNDRPHDIAIPPIPKSTSAFSLKNAGRTLSWGRQKHPSLSSPKETKSPQSPRIDEERAGRARAVTSSSYASTATPPKIETSNDLGGLSLGGDFSDMFSSFGKRKSVVMDAEASRTMSASPEGTPSSLATRSYQPSRANGPSPLSLDPNKFVEPSPYSWSSQHSREGLMSSITPPLPRDTPPPVPQHDYETQPYSRPQKPANGDNGLRRSSAFAARRQSTLEYGDTIDEDARLLRESINASRHLEDPSSSSSRVRDSWALPSDSNAKFDDTPGSSWKMGSTETTPRANKVEAVTEDNMFDTQIQKTANITNRFQDRSWSAATTRNAPVPKTKVMTPAQFERAKQDQERLRSIGGPSKDTQDEEEEEEETYDDDEDDAEKAKQLAKQRRKQEAHMSVYRQQMMKVTGDVSGPAGRSSVFASHSSPNLTFALSSGEDPEEDEEVPLAILQAHGFPSKTKPPMRSMGSNPNLRGSGSVNGGVVGSGNLPVFARNLPQDPYYGAGIVTPAHRESIAFGGGSVSGAPARGLPPGGLVGVIATEERSRAMRRGSPNPDGTYGQAPSNGYNGLGPVPMQQPTPGSIYGGMPGGSMAMPMGPMGPINPMLMTPGDHAQMQMSQQMSQFMQMQMQFMQMMTQGGQQQTGHMAHASMGEIPRPGSSGSQRPGLNPYQNQQHQRAMTMLEPNAAPWMQHGSQYAPSLRAQGNGYAPSIAPSERSNVGLPGRYRPVSQAPPVRDSFARTSTMSGALPNWETKNGGATIRAVKKSGNVSDEDDEEGWEEMAKKREKKKSIWRIKKDKDSGGLKDFVGFAQ